MVTSDDEINKWKLRELNRSRRAKVLRSGLQVQFESNRYLKLRSRRVFEVQASRSSLVRALPGIGIHSVRR